MGRDVVPVIEPHFTRRERALIRRLRTPHAVQQWIRGLPYNWERTGATLKSFRGVVRDNTAHCLEAAFAAATIMEQHGYPALLLDLESRDRLDHVVFAFRSRGRWGAVGGSRDMGLFGRRAVFRTPRALAMSYYEPYIDLHARITGYAIVDLANLGGYDWRTSERNMWKTERFLIRQPHRRIRTSDARYRSLRGAYREYIKHHPPTGTPHTRGRRHWM